MILEICPFDPSPVHISEVVDYVFVQNDVRNLSGEDGNVSFLFSLIFEFFNSQGVVRASDLRIFISNI